MSGTTRRKFFHLAIAGAFCALAAGAFTPAAAADRVIKVGTLKLIHGVTPYFYEKFAPAGYKIEVVPFESPTDGKNAVVTGTVAGLQTTNGEAFTFTVVDGEIAVTAGNQTIVLSENFSSATGQSDNAGQIRVFEFTDTAQNVIARNAATIGYVAGTGSPSLQVAPVASANSKSRVSRRPGSRSMAATRPAKV